MSGLILSRESVDRIASSRVRLLGTSCSCQPQSRSSPPCRLNAFRQRSNHIRFSMAIVSLSQYHLRSTVCTTITSPAPNDEPKNPSSKSPGIRLLYRIKIFLVTIHSFAANNRIAIIVSTGHQHSKQHLVYISRNILYTVFSIR